MNLLGFILSLNDSPRALFRGNKNPKILSHRKKSQNYCRDKRIFDDEMKIIDFFSDELNR